MDFDTSKFEYTEADNKTYSEHYVFEHLKKIKVFYELLSDLVMQHGNIPLYMVINYDSYVYTSIAGTIDSITIILKKGRVGDAFALLRKFRDLALINIYISLITERANQKEIYEMPEIRDWLKGFKRLPLNNYKSISKHLENSEELKSLFEILNEYETFKEIRNCGNNHIHLNFFENLLINDNKITFVDRLKLLNTFTNELELIFVMHIACLFHIKEHYMRSSDYVDALDIGVNPDAESVYWVSPIAQEIFSEFVSLKFRKLAEYVVNSTNMMLKI